MECGHACEEICHAIVRTPEDPSGHDHVVCYKKCVRPKVCGIHKCD